MSRKRKIEPEPEPEPEDLDIDEEIVDILKEDSEKEESEEEDDSLSESEYEPEEIVGNVITVHSKKQLKNYCLNYTDLKYKNIKKLIVGNDVYIPENIIFPNTLTHLLLDAPSEYEYDNLPKLPSGLISFTSKNFDFINISSPLPKSLETLHIESNVILQFDEFPHLPKLKKLILSGCSLNELPDILSFKLKEINVSHNNLTTLPKSFDNLQYLEILNLSNNHFSELPEIQISSLKELNISYNSNLEKVPDFNEGLEILNFEGCNFSTFSKLPSTIKYLTYQGNHFHPNIENSLIKLTGKYSIENINSFNNMIQYVFIDNETEYKKYLENKYNLYKKTKIEWSVNKKIPYIPNDINSLIIKNNDDSNSENNSNNDNIKNSNIKYLLFNRCTFNELDLFPETLEIVAFSSCDIKSKLVLPVNIIQLNISNCLNIDIENDKIPISLKNLLINNSECPNLIANLSKLVNLEVLELNKTSKLKKLPMFPKLKGLALADQPVLQNIEKYPDTLTKLRIENCAYFDEILSLPENLNHLYIDNKILYKLPKELPNLNSFILKNTDLRYLPKMPNYPVIQNYVVMLNNETNISLYMPFWVRIIKSGINELNKYIENIHNPIVNIPDSYKNKEVEYFNEYSEIDTIPVEEYLSMNLYNFVLDINGRLIGNNIGDLRKAYLIGDIQYQKNNSINYYTHYNYKTYIECSGNTGIIPKQPFDSHKYVKMNGPGGVPILIKDPQWLFNISVLENIWKDDQITRIFKINKNNNPLNKYVSSNLVELYSQRVRSSNYSMVSADHCNQEEPTIVYDIEEVKITTGGRNKTRKSYHHRRTVSSPSSLMKKSRKSQGYGSSSSLAKKSRKLHDTTSSLIKKTKKSY